MKRCTGGEREKRGERQSCRLEGKGGELITCQLCAGTEVRLELAFGGREVSPRDRTNGGDKRRRGSITEHVHRRKLTNLVEGHLLRYASGLAAASGTSLPHRPCRRVPCPGAAGLVAPAAVATEAAADPGRPDIQGRKRAQRSSDKRHSRHTKHEHPADDHGDVDDVDDDTRDRPVSQPSAAATHIRHERNERTPISRGGRTSRKKHSPCSIGAVCRARSLTRLPSPCLERACHGDD